MRETILLGFLGLVQGRDLLQEPERSSCWKEGRARSHCCYGAGAGAGGCFLSTEEQEVCCAYRSLNYGHLGFPGLEGLPKHLAAQLRGLLRRRVSRGRAAAMTAALLRGARDELESLRNTSRLNGFGGRLAELPDMSAAYRAFMVYFVVFHGLRKRLSSAILFALVNRETHLWSGFRGVYTAAWGHRDFCRCVEAGEFFARANSQFLELGIGQSHFLQAFLNGTSWQHNALSLQGCERNDDDMVHPRAIQLMAASSQCVPGNLATLIILLHSCILEQDMRKAFMLSAGIFQLATFAGDCVDAAYWGFTARDAILHYARLVWEVGAGRPRTVVLHHTLLKHMAWRKASLNRAPRLPNPEPHSWNQCGPHELGASTIGGAIVRPLGRSFQHGPYGPLCTELGRFWLQAEILKDPEAVQNLQTQRVLAILPITMAWEANPWHHLHWWLPALWFYKLTKRIDASQLEVALVFPHEDIDWAKSTAKGRILDANFRGHTEPDQWSLLETKWPKLAKNVRHFAAGGLHTGVLRWLSSQPARPLQEFHGESYSNVVLGLPSMRFFLQTPQLTCHQISAVKRWVQSSWSSDSGATEQPGLQLALLQRPAADGRQIENFDEVLQFVRSNFAELKVKVINNLVHGVPWVEQFRMFTGVDILVAAHGAGMAWLWAMRAGGAVIELRSRSSPVWLRCSEVWNADGSQIFGGLARLVAVHHICARPHDLEGTVTQARLSTIGDMTEEDAYNHGDNVLVFLPKLAMLLQSALALVQGEALPCWDYHFWQGL